MYVKRKRGGEGVIYFVCISAHSLITLLSPPIPLINPPLWQCNASKQSLTATQIEAASQTSSSSHALSGKQ